MENETIKTEQEVRAWTMDDVVKYVEQLVVYEEEIKLIQEAKKDWSKEFLNDHPIPKKELAAALAIAKKNLDADIVSDMYDGICRIICGEEA